MTGIEEGLPPPEPISLRGGLNNAPLYRINGGRAVNAACVASQLKTKRGEALIESFQATIAGDYFNTGTLSTSNSP